MDTLKEKREAIKTNAENIAGGSYWMICGIDGTVSLCSDDMSRMGVIPGRTNGKDYISAIHKNLFEDILRIGNKGGDVCYELEAAFKSGFEIVRVKSTRLFSSYGVEVTLYKNKEEYLAAASDSGERLGKVFDYIGAFMSDIDSVLGELRGLGSVPSAVTERLGSISRVIEKIMYDGNFVNSAFAENSGGEEKICDMVKIFRHVGAYLEKDGELPFIAAFEDPSGDDTVICATEPGRYARIILMMATVAARLSSDKQCRLTLFSNNGSATVSAECFLKKDYDLYGRSEKTDALYRCIPSNPVELMMLERFVSVPEWKLEYTADEKGKFVLSARIIADPNPDRFKYRDITVNLSSHFSEYLTYVKKSFLP